MSLPEEYKVKLEVFEGPLDLLLYLIRKEEVDIYDIPIERITSQYLQYLDVMRMLDLNIAGEFLVMSATLMMIKSRMLLPVEDRTEMDEEDEEDPRWDLVRQLVEYKKFKDAALHLERLELTRENVFSRSGEGVRLEADHNLALSDVNLFDLISAFSQALDNMPGEDLAEIFTEQFSVPQKIDDIIELLTVEHAISVTRLFGGMRSRQEVVCTFLAVLELIRLRQLRVKQDKAFDEIVVERVEDVA